MGLLFKGDGFYITDYRSDSYKKDASKEAKRPKPPGPLPKDKDAKTEGKSPPKASSPEGS
jgi:hypothetical protein